MKKSDAKLRKKDFVRKKYMKKMQLKPKYHREFLRTIPVLLIIMLVFDYAFTALAANNYIGQSDAAIEYKIGQINQAISHVNGMYGEIDFNQTNNATKPEQYYLALGNLKFKISAPTDDLLINNFFDEMYFKQRFHTPYFFYDYSSGNFFNAVYNTNGQMIANQSAGAYIILIENPADEENRVIKVYSLDIETIEKSHPDFLQHITESINPALNGGKNITLFFDDIYIKSDLVLPKTLELRCNGQISKEGDLTESYSNEGEEEEERGRIGILDEAFDLSDCDFSGYTKPDLTGIKQMGPVWVGDHIGRYYPEELFYGLDEIAIKEKIRQTEQSSATTEALEYTKYTVKGFVCSPTENESLVMIIAVDFDFFRDWKEILVRVYALSFAVALLAALIWGKISYHKKLIPFEIDAYRRKTTDAMAHDLKSPLMAISGYAENIVNHTDVSKTDYYADNILSVVNDMDRMISNILNLSKLENPAFTPEMKDISLKELTEKLITKYEPSMQKKGIEIVTDGEALIRADEDQMQHLMDNLILNAVKYSKEDSEIFIRFSEQSFSIRNEFDYELTAEPQTLLEPFVKGDSSRSNTQGGGLGLSIVNQIALSHGFSVDIFIEDNLFTIQVKMK